VERKSGRGDLAERSGGFACSNAREEKRRIGTNEPEPGEQRNESRVLKLKYNIIHTISNMRTIEPWTREQWDEKGGKNMRSQQFPGGEGPR
jgi:hypothetical protein